MQKQLFMDTEGDAWDIRNEGHQPNTAIAEALSGLQFRPKAALEIGCGRAGSLAAVQSVFGSMIAGIDPSQRAILHAQKRMSGEFCVATADAIPFPNNRFDLVIFGFCLYLVDPADYFLAAAEADRVLKDGGMLVIHDFLSKTPTRTPYKHRQGVYSHKMEFSSLFTAHPHYRLMHRVYREHSSPFSFQNGNGVSIDFLLKDSRNSFVTSL